MARPIISEDCPCVFPTPLSVATAPSVSPLYFAVQNTGEEV